MRARARSPSLELPQGQQLRLREVPVGSAAVYVPGGRAPYPSTVVMGVVTARSAGVIDVVVCSPPGPDGEIDPAVLGTCRLCGVERVYRMGGAQAIAALAYGTETVQPVDVIVGPGNLYVQEAKRQLSGDRRDRRLRRSLATCSSCSVGVRRATRSSWPRSTCSPRPSTARAASSLRSRPRRELLRALASRLAGAGGRAPDRRRGRLRDRRGRRRARGDRARQRVRARAPAADRRGRRAAGRRRRSRAGCLFVGAASATAFGDYVAGSNHILPTDGAARFASGLTPRHFRRRMTEVRVGPAAAKLAAAGAPIARAEGFEVHAESMEARIGENGPA